MPLVATITLFPLTGNDQGDSISTSVYSMHQDVPLLIHLPPHHATSTETTATMSAELHAVADTTLPTYADPL